MAKKSISIVFCICISLLITADIFADEYHNQQVLIGEKAAGMGGTFVAIGDGAEAAYHNPAGLTQLKISYISVSSQVLEYKQISQISISGEKEKLTSMSFVPSFWGFARDIGDYKFGFSIVVPNFDAYKIHKQYNDIKDAINNISYSDIKVDIVNNTQDYLIGPSIAKELNPKLSAGITLYLRYVDIAKRNYSFIKASSGNSEVKIEINDEDNGKGLGFCGNVGLLYKPIETFNIGLSLRTKTKITNTIDITRRNNQFTSNINSTTGNFISKYKEEQVKYNSYTPENVILGLKWAASKKMILATDISYHNTVNYNNNTKTTNLNVDIKKIINVNFGTEYMLDTNVPFRFGFYTDRSTAPKIIDNGTKQDSHIDNYGISLSSGILSKNSTLVLGVKYGWGVGRMTNYYIPEAMYKVYKVTTSNYAFNLSGSYNF
ncbi:MAG: outer membrane protein transport protein, partial [Bdellovibrio sp.]|nr:outer membrane protein transport protein [Bdellovibrio sp.]